MEWIYQFGETRPSPPEAGCPMVKVGAQAVQEATHVHLSDAVKPLAARMVMTTSAPLTAVKALTFLSALLVLPHLALICGQAAKASSFLMLELLMRGWTTLVTLLALVNVFL